MTTVEKQIEFRDKLQAGLAKAYEKLIVFKKLKKSKLVIIRDNKVVTIDPE